MNRVEKILRLREALYKESPAHDTPIGVIHPYWARKPLNIIECIIESLTEEGEIVTDPFMGSGTTVFAAIKSNRKVIATDINPLSTFIVQELIQLADDGVEVLLEEFIQKAKEGLLKLFKIEENRFIERERFDVKGDFEDGKFKLKLVETVSKQYNSGKWINRRVENKPVKTKIPEEWNNYLVNPINFSEVNLVPNSRIAIPNGAKLSDFYTELNRISINYMLELCENSKYSTKQKNACKFLLSSALPLLRLSDKKASSQWPFWRPKNNLTSRNPIIVLYDRLKKIKKGIVWLKASGIHSNVDGIKSQQDISNFKVIIGELAIQEFSKFIKIKSNLVLTDPPYTDHVPYLEYSAYWNTILGFKIRKSHYTKEIVNSDAPTRKNDTADYKKRLAEALGVCGKIIQDDGLVVWFYQDQQLSNWQMLYNAAKSNGLDIVDILPIIKQRRSMKTITTPGRTLDGDLLIIFAKNDSQINRINTARVEISPQGMKQEYYSQYVSIIKNAMLSGTINEISKNYNSIFELIKEDI